mmetsp:Transcript_21756/g.41501  ORF Transcript_21756/g.41501 Transcript_21756/m.41501 type:complete len:303 (+) Transcript_21756:152-1060(+)
MALPLRQLAVLVMLMGSPSTRCQEMQDTGQQSLRPPDTVDPQLPPVGQRHVVVVGSGRSMLGKSMGKVIDSFTKVVRFNIFRTKGFQRDVGSRTTHWVLSTIRDPNRMDLDEARRLTNIYVPIEPVAYKPARVKMVRSRLEKSRLVKKFKPKIFVGVWRKELGAIRTKFKLQEKHVSTGLQAIAYFGSRHKNAYFVGFDFELASHQHYWEEKIKNETCHNMQGEAETLEAMLADGLVRRLIPRDKDAAPTSFGRYSPMCEILCNAQGVCQKKLDGVVVNGLSANSTTQESGGWVKGVGVRNS